MIYYVRSYAVVKRLLLIICLFFLIATANAFQTDVQQVCFSPDENCAAIIVEQIDKAKSEILIQAYSFTSAPIAKALITAYKRGVKVEAVLDKSNETGKYSSATFISNHGIPVFIDSLHPIAHNKIMIIDRVTVITGSFNFTKAAEKNAENVLIINSEELVKKYLDNWQRHRGHSSVFHEDNYATDKGSGSEGINK
jgi:phosphatidylserine/phosphatidylglycerophosphate/cardiolipin synthase-like enzyme